MEQLQQKGQTVFSLLSCPPGLHTVYLASGRGLKLLATQRKANLVLCLENVLTCESFIPTSRITKPLRREHQLQLNFCVAVDFANVAQDPRGLGTSLVSQMKPETPLGKYLFREI